MITERALFGNVEVEAYGTFPYSKTSPWAWEMVNKTASAEVRKNLFENPRANSQLRVGGTSTDNTKSNITNFPGDVNTAIRVTRSGTTATRWLDLYTNANVPANTPVRLTATVRSSVVMTSQTFSYRPAGTTSTTGGWSLSGQTIPSGVSTLTMTLTTSSTASGGLAGFSITGAGTTGATFDITKIIVETGGTYGPYFDGSSTSPDSETVYYWRGNDNVSVSVQSKASLLTVQGWKPLVADATGLTITRGAVREGLGLKTDVGLCTFTLKDAQDPLDGGSLKPGQQVRVVSKSVLSPVEYEADIWFSTFDVWPSQLNQSAFSYWANTGLDGGYGAEWNRSGGVGSVTVGTLSLLTVGATYRFRIWVKANTPGATFGMTVGTSSAEAAVSTDYVQRVVTFKATATSMPLVFKNAAPEKFYLDNASLTRVNVVQEPTPIFSGRLAFLGSTYPMDKARGTSRALTTVTVSDAVAIHNATQRYGRRIASGYETFEDRINAYAQSANAPVEAPIAGAPKVVYSL